MQTQCRQDSFDFGTVEGRAVVAQFDGGDITSNAGALLLGAADKAIGLVRRLAACFHDERDPDLIEHAVATMVGQRVFGNALGHEDLNDHDRLMNDPVLATLAGKLASSRYNPEFALGRPVGRQYDCGKKHCESNGGLAEMESAQLVVRERTAQSESF